MKKPSNAELASVPEAVRGFMDGMLYLLEAIATRSKLELYPYHHLAPNHAYWIHNLYGGYCGWEITVQVYVNEALARERKARVILFFLFNAFEQRAWEEWEEERVHGIDGILRAVSSLINRAFAICARLHPVGTPNGLA